MNHRDEELVTTSANTFLDVTSAFRANPVAAFIAERQKFCGGGRLRMQFPLCLCQSQTFSYTFYSDYTDMT